MSSPAYKINDRRSSTGWGGNALYRAATQTSDHKTIDAADFDTAKNVSGLGRRTLMTIGRFLFSNFPAIEGAILEKADLAIATFIPQFWGANKKWGTLAENWLLNWFDVMNVAGWPHDGYSFRNLLLVAEIRDGDSFVLLTRAPNGYPKIQAIPAHRVGSRLSEQFVTGGQWDGARICDGVILDEYGAAVAYRVLDDRGTYGNYIDIPARDMFPVFDLKWSDQVRGFSSLASGAFDVLDVRQSRDLDLAAQLVASSYYATEFNESGEIDETKDLITSGATFNADGSKATTTVTKLEGGVRVYKAKTGCKVEFPSAQRPSADSRAFQETIMRDALQGMEWNYFFSADSTKVGGAPMRIIVEKIVRSIRKKQRMIEKTMRRVCGYALSKAIEFEILPPDPDWWKWDFQGPAEVTADKKYDSDVDIAELRARLTTRKRLVAKRGGYWEDTDDQLIEEEKRFQEKCAAAEVDPNRIELLTPNGNPAAADGGELSEEEKEMAKTEAASAATKSEMDAFGVGVRAGAITPTVEDEEYFRKKSGLPPLSEAARKAWGKEKNVRRPITLVAPDGTHPGSAPAAPGEDQEKE